jgi:hypothetical protein
MKGESNQGAMRTRARTKNPGEVHETHRDSPVVKIEAIRAIKMSGFALDAPGLHLTLAT